MQTQGIKFSVFTYTECATMNANDRIVSQQIIWAPDQAVPQKNILSPSQ